MADQIKQIYAGTATIGQLSDGVAIASTNATTQNTIKDITVQNNTVLSQLGINTNFVINGFTEASLNTSVTGSEYIDVSSTAVASATASFNQINFENWMVTNNSNSKINLFSLKSVNGVTSYTASPTQSAAIVATPTATSDIVSWQTVGSNFYYWRHDTNSVQTLYRRAGGVNGTETTIPNISSYQPIVFNGVDKFHWVNSTQVWTHNATTNTNTSVSLDLTGLGGFNGGSSYPRIAFSNGLIFWANSQSAIVYVINPTTGKMSGIASGIGVANPTTNVTFDVFMSGGNYYIVSTGNVSGGSSGGLSVTTIPVSTVSALVSVNTTGAATQVYSNATAYTPASGLSEQWPKMNSIGDFVFLSLGTAGTSFVYKRFNVVTQTFAQNFTVNLSAVSPNTTAPSAAPFRQLEFVDDSANKNNTTYYPQSISLRVTGVQTTL